MDTETWAPIFHHMGSRWTESLKTKVERHNGDTKLKTMTDHKKEIDGEREKGNNGGGSLWSYRTKVTPPAATGVFKGHVKAHAAVQYIVCTADWITVKVTTLFGEIIHTFSLSHTRTYTHAGYTLASTLLPVLVSFSLIFLLPCIWRGWQRWAHNLLMPKQRELDHPWADLPWSNASPICTLRCRGDRLGQTPDPCVALPLCGVCASAAGQHDSLYKALSNTWLTRRRPSRLTFTPVTAKLPQNPDRQPYCYQLCDLLSCQLLRVSADKQTFICSLF